MVLEEVLSFAVGIVALGIGGYMFARFWTKRRLHHLMWAIGLTLWAISSFTQGAALVAGWTIPTYKLYYFSAIALSGFLGAGTLGLIFRRPCLERGFVEYILAVSASFATAIAFASVYTQVLEQAVVGGLALPSSVRSLMPLINIPGAITFVGGAIHSVIQTRKRFAVFITLGATLPALGGIFARFSLPWVLPFTDFLGIVFLSAGVYLSLKPAAASMKAPVSEGAATPKPR